MKKKFLNITLVAAITVTAGWNFTQSENKITLSDLALSNVEALAGSETDEEFYEATGCKAVQEDKICTGKYGQRHSFAIRP